MMQHCKYFSLILTVTLFSCNGKPTKPDNSGLQSRGTSPSSGQGLYLTHCSGCHGSNGRAGILKAANLQTSKLDSVSVIQVINHGKNAMPAFLQKLDSGETTKVARYIVELRQDKK